MITKNKIIEDIISLPTKFYMLKKKSIHSLLKETGCFENYSIIQEEDIAKVLSFNQNRISEWLEWSDSKRVTSGWYFHKSENDIYKVGYFPFKENLKPIDFSNAIEACAAFIKREIEEIRVM